ncbi:MAG: S41 family peptidase [Bacteroidota bacterium]
MIAFFSPFLRYFFGFILLLLSQELSAQTVWFRLGASSLPTKANKQVGLRGSLPPLSWDASIPLTDKDGDGILEVELELLAEGEDMLEYKFVYGEEPEWELKSHGNRMQILNADRLTPPIAEWDVPVQLDREALRQISVSKEDLLADLKIAAETYFSLHPALNRYGQEAEVRTAFEEAVQEIQSDMSLTEAYLFFSRLVNEIQCGHTFTNSYNQNEILHALLFDGEDKLPFTFRWWGQQFLVAENLSEVDALVPGSTILSVNGVNSQELLAQLIPYSKGDGNNDAQRIYRLQSFGIDTYEPIDAFFPLVCPPKNGQYQLTFQEPGSEETQTVMVDAVDRDTRSTRLEQVAGPLPKTYDETWKFEMIEPKVGKLTLGTFVTYKMTMDWKGFIDDAFAELEAADGEHLILDIRGNGGGMDEVNGHLAKYLVREPATMPAVQSRVSYQTVPDHLLPYLSTWDRGFFDLSSKVIPQEGGYYLLKGEKTTETVIQPTRKAWKGKVWLITDASNGSATFFTARMCKDNGIATLVGQPSGGNRMGTNGGIMFFLRLPNSGIEMDLPIYGFYSFEEQPNEGIEPDILVTPTAQHLAEGRDAEVEAILAEIHR